MCKSRIGESGKRIKENERAGGRNAGNRGKNAKDLWWEFKESG